MTPAPDPTTLPEPDLEDFRAEYRRMLLGRFPASTLVWLAAVPEWPVPLAEHCSFPVGDSSTLADLVRELAAAGLVEQRECIDDTGELATSFWMPASRRPEIGGFLRQTRSAPDLEEEVRRLSAALSSAARQVPERWPQLRPWLEVDRIGPDPTGARLNDTVDRLLAAERVAAATELVAVTSAIGDVLGDPLASAARRATWRLDRAHRQAADLRSLTSYLPREEMDDVLLDLLDGRTGPIVHLLGRGGVGKTMLVRSLAAGEFTRRHGRPDLPVARVDFDYLDPRYPQTRPAELLLALAAGLTGYSRTRSQLAAYRRFDDVAAAVHESLAGADPGTDTGDPASVRAAVDAFADYLAGLASGSGGPVVLVLDTCEELAKLHAPGAPSPALERTFEILDQILARTSDVRILLAGRRPLVAPAGASGTADDVNLRRRDDVAVVPVGGFTVEQAVAYIDRRDAGGTVPDELRRAVLDRCTTEGEVNPFDLSAYLDWALDDPDLDPVALASAPGDPYVEQRILARITDPAVRSALPIAAQLGRFDEQMIAPSMARRGVDPGAAFSGLAGQEWVGAVSFHPDGRPRVIEVDEHLRVRLRVVLDADRGHAVDVRALGEDLHRLVAGSAVPDLPIEAVEAALRLLTPADAGRMWADVEAAVAAARAWGWAVQVLPRVAAVEAELAATRPETVAAAILATQAAAVQRRPGRPGVRALWDDVAGLAGRHPDPGERRRLRFRAACGRLAAAGGLEGAPPDAADLRPDIDVLLGSRDGVRELPFSVLAALDGLTRGGAPLPAELAPAADALTGHDDPRIAVAALLVRATGHIAAGSVPAATGDVEKALARIAGQRPGSAPDPVDWVPPPRPLDRVRLARLCCALLAGERPQRSWSDAWRADPVRTRALDDIDAERLVAASIALDEGWQLLMSSRFLDALNAERYAPGRQPTHHWHRHTPPLRPLLLRALGESGSLDPAVKELQNRRKEAVEDGSDPDTITACDAVLVDLCRTSRLSGLSDALNRMARDGTPELRAGAHAVLSLAAGRSPKDPTQAGGLHAWWRAQVVVDDRSRRELARRHRSYREQLDGDPSFADRVDEVEVLQLEGATTSAVEDGIRDTVRSLTAGRRLVAAGSDAGLGPALRASALLGIPELDDATAALPPRLVGRAAMAEGELLALRLPAPSIRLLQLARGRFAQSHDDLAAERAQILLLLTASRVGVDAGDVALARDGSRASEEKLGEAWARRRQASQALLAGDPLPEAPDPSPELALLRRDESHVVSVGATAAVDTDADEAAPSRMPAPPPRPAPAQASARTSMAPPSETSAPPSGLPPAAGWSRGRRWLVIVVGVVLAVAVAVAVAAMVGTIGPGSAVPTASPTVSTGSPTVPATGTPIPTPTRTPSASPTVLPTAPGRGGGAVLWGAVLVATAVALGSGLLLRRRSRSGAAPVPSPVPSAGPQPDSSSSSTPGPLQQTVALYLQESGPVGMPCRVRIDSGGVTLRRTESAPLASDRPYIVLPVVEPGSRHHVASSERAPGVVLPQGTSPLPVRIDGPFPATAGGLRTVRIRWNPAALRHPVRYLGPSYLLPPKHLLPPGTAIEQWEPGAACSLLHLVGDPVPTAAGWRLRVGGVVSEKAQYTSSRSTLSGEELIAPDDVATGSPAVVVLQASPADGPPDPPAGLVEALVQLADGLHDAGVTWVVVLPPMTDRDVTEAVRRSATAVRAGGPSDPGLVLDVVHDLRTELADRAADVLLLCRGSSPEEA